MIQDDKLIELFARHADFFWDWILKYYPLKEEVIRKHHKEMDFGILSQNENLKWTESFLYDFSDKWNMEFLSQNKAIPWSETLLLNFPNKFNRNHISINPSLPWSTSFINKYSHVWNYHWLTLNDGIVWTEDLLLDSKIINAGISDVYAPHILTKDFILKNINTLCLEDITRNKSVNWDDHFINELSPLFSHREWMGLSANVSIKFTGKQIENLTKNKDENKRLDFNYLSLNPSLCFQEDNLINLFKQNWNWRNLTMNRGVGFTVQQLKEYQLFIKWKTSGSFSSDSISFSGSIKWNEEIIEMFKDKWDWWFLSQNEFISWNDKMIKKYEKLFNWRSFVLNINGPFTLDFVLKYEYNLLVKHRLKESKINYDLLFKNILNDEIIEKLIQIQHNPYIQYHHKNLSKNHKVSNNHFKVLIENILRIDTNQYIYTSDFHRIDKSLSEIQTLMVHLSEKEENIKTPKLNKLQQHIKVGGIHMSKFIFEINSPLKEYLKKQGILELSLQTIKKQNDYNQSAKLFYDNGGHASYDYTFLHEYIKKYGKINYEIARLISALQSN